MKLGMLLLLLCSSVFASNLSGFDKRFELIRDDNGKLTAVNMKMFTKNFSIWPYINQIKNDIKAEIERMGQKGHEQELEEFINYLEQESNWKNDDQIKENSMVVRQSLKGLINVKVDQVFQQALSEGVIVGFEKDIRDVLLNFSLSIIANPNDARFFYRRHVIYEVVKKALEIAKERFSDVPVLNLVSFIIVKVHDLMLDQRLYHQNMLLHYLQNFPESELGLSKDEADHVFSSIYESRIGVTDILSSNRAAANWDRYGTDIFFEYLRVANSKVRRTYSANTLQKRYNFAFVEVLEEGKRVVKNIFNTKHMLSGNMATAYEYEAPNKVKRTRALLNLAQVGLGFLPVAGWLKNQVDGFLQSFYVEQSRTEGALMAYFESNGNMDMFHKIHAQARNPYLIIR